METNEKTPTVECVEDSSQIILPASELAIAYEDAQRQQDWKTALRLNPRPMLWCKKILSCEPPRKFGSSFIRHLYALYCDYVGI